MRFLLAIILVFLLQAICRGQTGQTKALDFQPDYAGLETPQIKLEDYLTLSQRRYTTRYEGLQGVLVSRGNNQFRKYQNHYLNNLWSASNYNLCEWDRFLQDYEDRSVDFQYGRWWDRSLLDSYIPEKGGVIVREVVVGRELPLLRWGDVTLTNTGKIRLGRWGFDVAQVTVPSPRTLLNDPTTLVRQQDPPLSLRALVPRGVLDAEWLRVTTIQNITLRASLKPERILARVEIGLNMKFYSGYPPKQWANLAIRGRSSPFDHYYEAYFNFELLCF